MCFLGLSFKSHWRVLIPKQNRGWLLYFYHSCFIFFSYAPNCRNLPELAFACYVVVEKKSGPVSKGESSQQTLRTKPENLVEVSKTCGDFDVVVTSVRTFK